MSTPRVWCGGQEATNGRLPHPPSCPSDPATRCEQPHYLWKSPAGKSPVWLRLQSTTGKKTVTLEYTKWQQCTCSLGSRELGQPEGIPILLSIKCNPPGPEKLRTQRGWCLCPITQRHYVCRRGQASPLQSGLRGISHFCISIPAKPLLIHWRCPAILLWWMEPKGSHWWWQHRSNKRYQETSNRNKGGPWHIS